MDAFAWSRDDVSASNTRLACGHFVRICCICAASLIATRDIDDDTWLKHTLNWNDNGEVRLDYKPVTITKHQPLARSY